MTTSHLKMVVDTSPETPCILNVPQAMDTVQHSLPVMNKTPSQICRESLMFLTKRLIDQLTTYRVDKL
jgi:hypothetical protein